MTVRVAGAAFGAADSLTEDAAPSKRRGH